MYHEKFTQSELEEKASEIMRNFNFEKVHEHMVATNWRWASGSEGRLAIPDMEDIRNCARSLLSGVIWSELPVSNQGTGGFVAYKLPWGLQLTFQLSWSNS
jgi:hypothetical protein